MLNQDEDFRINFSFEKYLEPDIDESLDTTKEICRFFQKGHCLKGKYCPFRHVRQEKAVVCKHWLRGLCKKGDNCEFLHEYDPKKMPECWFYAKYGECSNLECIFLHINPEDKIKTCPWYDRGFCRHGPNCRYKHKQQVACPDYLAGFCPAGPNCKYAHPQFDTPKEEDFKNKRPLLSPTREDQYDAMDMEEEPTTTEIRPTARFDDDFDQFDQPVLPQREKPQRQYRPLEEVTCFKCKQRGHYANRCPNRKVNYQRIHQLPMSRDGSVLIPSAMIQQQQQQQQQNPYYQQGNNVMR